MFGQSVSFLDLLLHTLPLWLVWLVLVAACLLALEAGRLYRRFSSRGKTDDHDAEKSDTDGYIIGAIYGLLAFLTGLTFSIALERYDGRRELVVDEANAISTAYLRASLFDEPQRTELQTLLHQYARSRIAPEGVSDKGMNARLENAQALRVQLWDAARVAILPVRDTERGSYFVEAMNETLNVGTRRELAGRAHIPTTILEILFLYLLISAAAHGYLVAGSTGRRNAAMLLLALFVVAIVLILDIDRPRSGSIMVPQRALEELITMLDRDARLRQGATPLPETPASAPPSAP